MLIQIEANSIDDLLADDEMLVPTVEDVLLDTLINYRDTKKHTKHDPRRIKISESLSHPRCPMFTGTATGGRDNCLNAIICFH